MPAENVRGRASERLDDLLNTLAKLPESSTEELREAVRAMGIDPGEAVARVRDLMAAREHEVRLEQLTVARGIQIGRLWLDRRFVKIGTGAGALGGVCCLGKAVTLGAGLGISSFFGTMVDKYQLYFVVGSLALLALWLFRVIGTQGVTATGLRTAIRSSVPQAAVSFGAYFVTLGFTIGVMALADWLWPRP